ncbi:MAG: translational GTPase TypA [Phycisphaeraceae bacterium]|nr:translational GTPase TypA [Phycisphaeraceae bacterium]
MQIRNVAIIAHVDHGKTSLVDQLLYQSGMFRDEELNKLAGGQHGLIMDSNDLERERGITILSKNCSVHYVSEAGEEFKINLVDTPGHSDFGGEVERVLALADGVLLVVDAFEGPMPQTRFVLGKALEHHLKPIVVVNKIDRPDARPDEVMTEVFDLLVDLHADDDALDFPHIYCSAKEGWASLDELKESQDMRCIFESIITHLPAPRKPKPADDIDPDQLQMMITSLDYSDYVGRIGIGRVFSGSISGGQTIETIQRSGKRVKQRVLQTLAFEGLSRKEVKTVEEGDICALIGLDPIDIGDIIVNPDGKTTLKPVDVDQPTLTMTFRVNDSPFNGREGTYVTSRQIKDRLDKELRSNVALRVAQGESPEEFAVSGRGLMHLGILIENMRREGFELSAGKPRVIFKEVDGKTHEPIEMLVVDCPQDCSNAVMSLIGDRRAEMLKMDAKAGTSDFVHMEFRIPARGLIGLRTRMLNATQGRAIMHHSFDCYEPIKGEIPKRQAGVMVATEAGPVTAYALDKLYDRGFFFVKPQDQVYEGQIVGEHCKEGDIDVNVCTTKKLSNMRTTSKDDAAQIRPPRILSLEACLEYIQEDELVEITPESIRIRKRLLKEADRRRENRKLKNS